MPGLSTLRPARTIVPLPIKTWLLINGLPHELARGLQAFKAKLQVTGNLFERVPDVILVFEQLRMSRVFEVKKIGGRKHE
jgi:hypothetical protein